jgi:DNA-binding HxlR family transcriptional regulator
VVILSIVLVLKQSALFGYLGTFWYIFMNLNEKIFLRKSSPEKTARMVETIFGCKWSLTVYQLLANGINRPGEMVRSVEGLTTKVLNQCLNRNIDFGILDKQIFNELPPRVEYEVTDFGQKFIKVLEQIESLQQEIDREKK